MGRLDAVFQDRLQVGIEALERVPVEDVLEGFRRLVVRGQHVVLGDVLRAEAHVGGRVVELEAVDDAALHGRHDLAAGKLRHRCAHRLEEVGGEADGAVFQALQLGSVGDLALEPAERLGRHAEGQEADDVEAEDVLRQLAVELLAAAVIEPGDHLVGVAAEHRAGAEQRGGLVLAVPVDRHGVGRVDGAVMAGVLHLEGADHGAGRQQVDLDAVVRHLLHALDILRGHLLEDVRGRPGRLHLQRDRRLGEHGGRGERRTGGRRAADGGGLEEFAA